VVKSDKMELLLDKADKLKLLFKFITYREPIIETNDELKDEDIDYKNQYKVRSIKISIIS
jgi:hypothetical protein